MDGVGSEPKIYVGESSLGGRGVFSNVNFEPGETIEFCPMLVLPESDREWLDKSSLYDYYFEWGPDSRQLALALGYGSIYNHSYDPNAIYETYFEEKIMVIKSHLTIKPHEEILISYNQDPNDRRKVWFEKKEG